MSELFKAGNSGHDLVFPDGKCAVKGFDLGLGLTEPPLGYPPIVFEVGVDQSELELRCDAWDWLCGSCGVVQVVVVVKLNKPVKGSAGEFSTAEWGPAYAEVWEIAKEQPESGGISGVVYILLLLVFRLTLSRDICPLHRLVWPTRLCRTHSAPWGKIGDCPLLPRRTHTGCSFAF